MTEIYWPIRGPKQARVVEGVPPPCLSIARVYFAPRARKEMMSRAYGTTADVMRKRATHIPKPDGRTYCGKKMVEVDCINLAKDAIDEATCKACQRSDDRRTREQYMQSDEYKKQQEENRG